MRMQVRSQPARIQKQPSTLACILMEHHEILDATHATIARSYLDLELVLEDLFLVLLSTRFYIRIVAFCMVLMTLFAFAAYVQNLPSVFQTGDFLTAALLRSHQHAALRRQTQGSNSGHPPFPFSRMSRIADADACFDAIEDIEALAPRQWPQCHRMDASPSRVLQEGFAKLLDQWMRHPEHSIRLNCINRMGHLCNFLLDILCILGVHGMTFSIARMHSLSAFFVDYLRIDPQLDVDRMLENRRSISPGYRMAGKYLAIIQPFSALLANVKFRSRHNMHAYMQPSLELLREWEACLGMDDIALTIRSCIALLESINSYVHMLPTPPAVVGQAPRVGGAGRRVDALHA